MFFSSPNTISFSLHYKFLVQLLNCFNSSSHTMVSWLSSFIYPLIDTLTFIWSALFVNNLRKHKSSGWLICLEILLHVGIQSLEANCKMSFRKIHISRVLFQMFLIIIIVLTQDPHVCVFCLPDHPINYLLYICLLRIGV